MQLQTINAKNNQGCVSLMSIVFFLSLHPFVFFNWFNDMWMLGCTQNIQFIHGHDIGTNDDVLFKSL
jgi:hypothetical protein